MAEERRFDWGAILTAAAIIVGVTAALGLIVPAVLTLGLGLGHTGRVAGHDAYRWGFWAVAWALTIWQGAVMLRKVHERIVDDMLVTSIIAAVALFLVKMVIGLVYEPLSGRGTLLPIVTSLDTGGALILVLVALIGARVNRF